MPPTPPMVDAYLQINPRLFFFVAGFVLIALASKQIGHFFTQVKFPLITGFLVTGILAGP